MSTCKIGYDPSFYTKVMANRILLDDDAFLNFLIDLFNETTATAIVDAISSGNFNKDTVFAQSEDNNTIKIQENPSNPGDTSYNFYTPKPFHSFFEGGMEGRQYKQAWNQFLRELVSRLVYNSKTGRSIPDPNRLNGNGINIVTQEIFNYIKDLIDKIAPVLDLKLDTLPFNTSKDNWTELMGLVTDAFNNALVKNRIFLDSDIKNNLGFSKAYTAYAILSSIDELLERSGLVSIKQEYAGKNIFTKDKYVWIGNSVAYIERYNEEDANIDDYTSPIVSLILDNLYLRKEDSYGKIGLNGFTAVVGKMASWLRTNTDENIRKEFEKGLDANWSYLISSYKGSLGKKLTTLEQNILDVIKTDIFDSKMHEELKNLFAAQILNTNQSIYLEISDSNGSVGMSTTESHIYDRTVYSLKKVLAGTIAYIGSDSKLFDAYTTNTGITVSDPKNRVITLSMSLPNNSLTITVNFNKLSVNSAEDVVNAITADTSALTSADIKALNDKVSLWTGIAVPNVIADKTPLFRLLGLAVGLSYNKNGIELNKFISFNNTYGSHDFVQGNFNSNCIAADINALSEILGTTVVKTIKDVNGNILPKAQLNSWYTTVDHIINQARSIPGHALRENLMVNPANKKAYLGTGIRKTIKIGNKSKTMKDLIPSEALHWSIIYDFLKPLAAGDSKVWLQPMVFADKIRQFLDHIDLAEIHIGVKGNTCTLYDAINALRNRKKLSLNLESHDPLLVIKRAIIEQRKKSAYRAASVLIENAVKAFGVEAVGLEFPGGTITDAENIYTFITNNIEDFNTIWDNINNLLTATGNWADIATVYKNANSTLHGSVEEQIDIVKTTKGNYILNPLLKHTIDTFNSDSDSEEYFKSIEDQFASELDELGFRFSPETIYGFNSLGKDANINIKVNGELNPLLQAYLYTHLLVGQQLQEIHQGSFWNYRTKKTFDSDNPNYQADIAHRFIDQSKRAMGAGATIKRILPKRWGTSTSWRAAAVSDLLSPVNGLTSVYKDKELVADGCVYASPEQAILENWSMPDGKTTDNFKKLIFSQIDKGSAMNQIKTAAFTITNELRRRNPHSVEMNMEKVYRMTHQDAINLGSWISDYYNLDGTSYNIDNHTLTHTTAVYFWNPNTNSYYKVLAVGFNENGLYRSIQAVDSNGNLIENSSTIEYRPPLLNGAYSMYDLDQLFGGAWCMKLDKSTNTLVNDNSNNTILATIMCGRQELKNSIIYYIVPTSSFKVGMQNINDASVFNLHQPDSKLWEFNIDPYNVGIQLNAGHYVEGGYVSEPSQLMQALGQEGVLGDLVDNIYNELVNITKSIREKFSQGDLKQAIAEELLYSINHSGSSKTITDVFIMRMQNSIEQRMDIKLPLSSPGINQKFEQVILQSLNRSIKHRFPGLGTVQAPSWGYMQHFGNGLTYKELLNKLSIPAGYTIKDVMEGVWNGIYLDEAFVNAMLSTRDSSGRLPIIEQIPSKQIDFEDTLLIKTNAGYQVVKIDGIKKYDEYRNLNRAGTTVLRWNTQGRDLLQQIVRFTINGDTSSNFYTLYDFDSSRATFYLSEIIKNKKLPEFWADKKAVILATLSKNKTPEEIEQITKVLDSPLSNINTLEGYLKTAKRQFKEDCISYSNTNKVGTPYKFFMNAAGGSVELNLPQIQHAKVILGRLYAKKLGLRPGDNVRTVLDQGYKFFENRLKEQFSKSTTLNGLVDATFYTETGQIQVVIGDNPKWSEMAKTSRIFNNVNGSIYYKGNQIKGAEGIEFGTFVDSDGNTHDFVKVKNARQLRALQNNGQLGYLEYNYTKGNIKRLNTILNRGLSDEVLSKDNIGKTVDDLRSGERERKNKFIYQWAKGRFEAFKSSLTMVGARIPTQALQSVSTIDVIGFTDSTENEIYLPKVLTWVAGSDYDIDKFYVMGWNILDDGRLPHKGNLYEYSQEEVDSLPNPTGEEFEIYYPNQADLYSPENVITLNINDLRSEGIETLKQVLESGKHIVHFVGFSDDTGTPAAMEELCLAENFISTLNRYNNETNAKRVSRFSTAIAMNNALKNIIIGLDDVAVQDALLSPLNTDETDRLADKNAEAKVDKTTFNPDLPTSIFKQQYNNMVGKASVGIVAQNTKTFNVITYNINAKLNALERDFLSGKISAKEVEQYLDGISFVSPLHPEDTTPHTFGGLNFRKLITTLKLKGETTLANKAQILQNNSLKNDPYDGLSNLMSAATDNAKLLDLSPLNATGNILNLYCYLVSIGESLEDAANLFTSKIFNVVNKFVSKNIFETDAGNYTALQDALNFLMDNGELNVVNRFDLYRLYQQRIASLYKSDSAFTTSLERAIKDLEGSVSITINGHLNFEDAAFAKTAYKLYRNKLKQDLNNSDNTEWDALLKAAKSLPASKNTKNRTISPAYYIENYLKLKYRLLYGIEESEFEKLETAYNLLNGSEEFTALGRLLKINQGQGGTSYEQYKITENFNNSINSVYTNNKLDADFDLTKFFREDENAYRIAQINKYEGVKARVNLLDFIYNSPHFREMYKSVIQSGDIIQAHSLSSALLAKLTKEHTSGRPMSSDIYNVISKYISDVITYTFIKNLPKEFSFNYNGEQNLIAYSEGDIQHVSANGGAYFKRFVEKVLIPSLKTGKFSNNAFVQNLSPTTSYRNGIKTSNYSISATEGEFDQTVDQYEAVKEDFLELVSQKLDNWISGNVGEGKVIHEWTYGDVFYLYHLMISGERYGSRGLGALFGELVTNEAYQSPLASSFLEAISNLDALYQSNPNNLDKLLPYNTNDLASLIKLAEGNLEATGIYANTDKVFKFQGETKPEDPAPYRDLKLNSKPQAGRELPFELYNIFKDIFGQNRIQLASKEFLDSNRGRLFNNLSDDEFNSLKNTYGFIHNGVIYLNQDNFSGGTLFHEFAHIIAAHVKFSDNPWYYNAVDVLWNSDASSIRKIKKDIESAYPDRSIMDKKEELFAEYISRNIMNNFADASSGSLKARVDEAIRQVFRIEPENIDFSRLSVSKIEDVLSVFKSALFSTSGTAFDSTKIILNQKLSSIKNKMLNTLMGKEKVNIDGKLVDETMLIEDCK